MLQDETNRMVASHNDAKVGNRDYIAIEEN